MTEIKNPTRYHLPCVILLNKSGCMAGEPINTLNEALIDFRDQFKTDNTGSVIDICIIAFGGNGNGGPDIEILQLFAPANEMSYDTYKKPLIAEGGTPLADAVELGLREITQIRETYKMNGTPYYRPWLVCLTNESTENYHYYNYIKEHLKKEVEAKHVTPYSIGICEYNDKDSDDYYNNELYDFFGKGHTFRLKNGKFKELFNYLKDIMVYYTNDYAHPQVIEPIDSEGNQFLFSVVFDYDSEQDSGDKITDSEQANEVFADESETVENNQPKMPTAVDEEGNPLLHPVTFSDDSETVDDDEKRFWKK